MTNRNLPRVPVAVAWYHPDQWQRLKEVVDDPQNFDEPHAEWQRSFDRGLQYFRDQGYDVHKVPVDVDEFVLWCQNHQRTIDGKARSDFAADKLRKQFQPPPKN